MNIDDIIVCIFVIAGITLVAIAVYINLPVSSDEGKTIIVYNGTAPDDWVKPIGVENIDYVVVGGGGGGGLTTLSEYDVNGMRWANYTSEYYVGGGGGGGVITLSGYEGGVCEIPDTYHRGGSFMVDCREVSAYTVSNDGGVSKLVYNST